ncbi:MAG: 23S rRNA (adenine(2503)-C(2))-methyltransferase RlmN, partial [Hyphomicrobiales bacterium]|nr:23S rRNA (adenine(2503)-C(2))-methyltransferase RlmN [Hyphomicrobiales bacterium]
RAAQLWHWIYHRGAREFSDMRNIARPLLEKLAERYSLARPELVAEQVSADGTRKWLLRMPRVGAHDKGAEVECVYIPESDRGTLCVSSQVGCTLNCTFCHTGTQALVRNLSSAEIVAQVLVARDRLGDFPGGVAPTDGLVPSGEGVRAVSNIVFMGMGEPLYNFDNVREAIGVLTDGDGLSLSKRRITVSTSGVVPQMDALGTECGTMLAVSLHATNNPLRDKLVPLNKKYPIEQLLQACRDYPGASNARRITFEYVMLKGVNDSPAEAKALVRLLKGLPAKINLIPFNPWPGSPYECSDWTTIERFSDIVFAAGYASPVRTPRGRDILAACGQLKSETEKLRARARLMLEESLAVGLD